jgi:hypothetical protein
MTDADEIQVRAIEIDPETVQIVYVDEPRITAGGQPVAHSHILTVSRGDESIAPLLEDLVTTVADFVQDVRDAVAPDKTKSLDEVEAELEDDELDLGMGDDRDEVTD